MKLKLPSIVTLLILTTLTSILWISLNIYRAVTSEAAPSVPEAVSRSLNPVLDQETINEIQSRQFISPDQIPDTVTSSTPFPTTTPEIVATASPEASASAQASASPISTTTGGTGQ